VHPLGDCDSSGTETFPDYLTRLAAVSHRGSPPSPSFAFDGVRPPPEELVNPASTRPCGRFKRSPVNQPDLTFPQSPGIIEKRTTSMSLSAARFVLSMNWLHHSMVPETAHLLMCTTYPPPEPRGQPEHKLYSLVKPGSGTMPLGELFTAESRRKTHGEQVCWPKKPAKRSQIRAGLKIERGPAAGDFEGGQGGEGRASPCGL